ncbi:MAG: endonuclease Q family protein, partial [Nanoarchaeota archaeon]|nr:endonuclease Q family protein [Nanoarchaeota archaeon]
ACSKSIDIPLLEQKAKIKGATLLGTGDFTHPLWLRELKQNLTEEDSIGILKTKTSFPFILTTEISLMYTQENKGRKIHLVILAPDFETVDQINEMLLRHGRLDYDGRPIFGMTSPALVEKLKSINQKIEIIPAHIWTPWFGMFGSKSGFNSIKECFQDQANHIFAIETGLSSTPDMNWRIKDLDNKAILSFSDAHSASSWRLAREATIFNLNNLTYPAIIQAMKNKDPSTFTSTIEYYCEQGKYHYDGHRNCKVRLTPAESRKHGNMCPVCSNKLTIGVLNRVEELAERPEGFTPPNAIPFKRLIPLSEIIAGVLNTTPYTKKTNEIHEKLIAEFKTEFNILLNTPEEQLNTIVEPTITKWILKNRNQEIRFLPGYDGEYGIPLLNEKQEQQLGQKSLSEF